MPGGPVSASKATVQSTIHDEGVIKIRHRGLTYDVRFSVGGIG